MIRLFVLLLCLSQAVFSVEYTLRTFETNKKEVALTFDDGPKETIHPKILVTLDFFNIKASFFFIGSQMYEHPKLVLKAAKAHHTLGNHSYSHNDFSSLEKKDILEEISESQKIFHDILGEYPSYFRAPYGSLKPSQVKWIKPHFKHIINWNIDPEDWRETNSSEDILAHILKNVIPGSIILLHENQKSLEMLPQLIMQLEKQGYTFVSLAEALNK